MCSLQIVPDIIVEIIIENGIKLLWRHLGYIFHYKKNVKNLEDEKKKLQTARETVQEKIDEAEMRGEVIESNVSNWRNEADGLTQGVETFMQEKAAKENVNCFKFSSPNIISWYKLSKEAKNKMDEMKSHAEKANFATIARPKPPPPELKIPSSGKYMVFGSRAAVFDMIIEALEDPNVTMIGVYGTGGVGKTTMVKEVGDQVKKDGIGNQVNKDVLFDEVVIVVVSHEANIGKIQDDIAALLDLKLDDESVVRRAIKLWNRLNNGKRNLVILDDIWEKLDLKKIGIPITDGNKNCKVVLTSRNQRVLQNMQVYGDLEEAYRDFPIEVLSELEAWDLFKKKLGNEVDSHDPLHDTAHNVCRECKGLPVAILAVAAALKGKKLPAWKSSLDKLQKSMFNNIEDIDPTLFTSLRLSYDYLNSSDAKMCFLLCCSFPEDAQIPINELARHCMVRRLFHDQNPETLEEARDIVSSLASTLKTSCLLLEGENDDFVKIHDVVRDVAILIAKEERVFLVKHGAKAWPELTEADEKFLAISIRSETIRELPDDLVYPELHTLMLDFSRRTDEFWSKPELTIKISDKFFRRTEKLIVLELKGVIMSPLPSSLGELTELRMLYLNGCKLGDISTILKNLKNKLEILSLGDSHIQTLPYEFGELTRLRLLDLVDCGQLYVIPSGVISKLVRLEELYFPYWFRNWEAATGNEERSKVSLDELTSLPRLSTLNIRVRYLRQLPIDLFSPNLIRFHVRVGDGKRYEDHECSRQGVMLIEDMCSSDDDLNTWERLLGKPKWFNNLTQLVIEDCGSLKSLFSPSSANELQQLQSLEICGCKILESVIRNEGETDEEIIGTVVNFSQLRVLTLNHLPCLLSFYPRVTKATTGSQSLPPAQCLFNEKVAFPALETLRIWDLEKIAGIWDMQTFSTPEASNSLFTNLRIMNVDRCSNLENVIKGFSNMEVRGAEEIKESQVANYVLQFPQLRSLELIVLGIFSSFSDASRVTQTRPLFDDQVAFPVLEALRIYSLPNITEIWDKNVLPTESFCLLRSLEVCNCAKLMNVFPSRIIPLLQNLGSLLIQWFPEMEVIVVLERREEETQEATNEDIIRFSKLTKLKLVELENLKGFCAYRDLLYSNAQVALTTETQPLFNHKVAFHSLEELTIDSVPNITEIWDKNLLSTRFFGPLRSLKVKGCEKLINVFPSNFLPLLLNIKSLIIIECPKVEVIAVLEKRGEETQEATNEYIIQFPKLTAMSLTKLENLKGICAYVSEDQLHFNMQGNFPALKELFIKSLPRITSIWGIQSFPVFENAADLSFSELRINDSDFITDTQPLFNHQVQFSALEELCIDSMPYLTEIWDKNLLPTKSRLRSLKVEGCEKLINVFPSHMLPLIQSIEILHVSRCSKMEVIIVLGKREEEMNEATNKHIIEFPKLRELCLKQLEKLKGICAYKSGDQLYFDVQVAFPKLRVTYADDLCLDAHSEKIFEQANKEILDALPRRLRMHIRRANESSFSYCLEGLSEEEDVLEDKDEETHKKANPSERKPIESTSKTPILGEDDKEDEDGETPKSMYTGGWPEAD